HPARPGAGARLLRPRGLRAHRLGGARGGAPPGSCRIRARATLTGGMRGRTARTVVVAMLALLACAPAAQADWSGDAKADVLAIDPSSGALLPHKGPGGGAFGGGNETIGSGWGSFTALLSTEFSGDGKQDLLVRN